jgi:hypothetical protein
LNRSDEAVSAACQGFDEAGARSGIAQDFAYFVDGGVEAVVEVDEGVGGPEFLLKIFAGHDFSGAVEEHGKDLEGLSLEAKFDAAFAEFAGVQVEFEDAEADDAAVRGRHERPSLASGDGASFPRKGGFRVFERKA